MFPSIYFLHLTLLSDFSGHYNNRHCHSGDIEVQVL